MDSRQKRFPPYMVFCVSVSCLGSFSMGWTIGSPNIVGSATHACSNGSRHAQSNIVPDCLPMDSLLWGFAVSSFCIGGLFASLCAGSILTSLGRRMTILLNNLGWILGSMFIGLAVSPAMFILGRILCGLSCGLGSVATPTYNGEISTTKGRGAMGTLNQLFIVIGILLSNLVGLPLAEVPLWRLSYALVAVPAILQMVCMPLCVESPRYLVSRRQIEDARLALQRLRGEDCTVDDELAEIIAGQLGSLAPKVPQMITIEEGIPKGLDEEQTLEHVESAGVDKAQQRPIEVYKKAVPTTPHQDIKEAYSIIELFTDPVVRRVTLIVMALHASQQFSAVNGVMYYSTIIFNASFDAKTSMYMAIATSGINLLVTIASVALIDHLGRRFLLILAQAGGCLTAVTLTIGGYYHVQWLLVTSVFLFVASFAIGLGPIPWMITSELAPTHAASSMGAIATAVNWAANFCIGLIFPTLIDKMQSFAFLLFGGILFIATLFSVIYVPETKGRSIEEIQSSLEQRLSKDQSDTKQL